nr:MAG TPA: hypothetical protein [Caudoviricetes sp.]
MHTPRATRRSKPPGGHQARHVVTTPRRGTRRGAIFVASGASVVTNNQAIPRTTKHN